MYYYYNKNDKKNIKQQQTVPQELVSQSTAVG
jgi:hypothetical protein